MAGNKTSFHFKRFFFQPSLSLPHLFRLFFSFLPMSHMLVYALAILNGLPFSRCQLQGVTGNSLVTFTPAVKKMLPRVSTENRFCFSFVKEHKPFQDEKCNKFEMTLFFTLHVLLTAVPIGHAFYNIPATHNTYRDKHQPFVSLPISRRFDKELRLNLANFKSNENPVFY